MARGVVYMFVRVLAQMQLYLSPPAACAALAAYAARGGAAQARACRRPAPPAENPGHQQAGTLRLLVADPRRASRGRPGRPSFLQVWRATSAPKAGSGWGCAAGTVIDACMVLVYTCEEKNSS